MGYARRIFCLLFQCTSTRRSVGAEPLPGFWAKLIEHLWPIPMTSPSDFVRQFTCCTAQQMIHRIVYRALKVGGAIHVLCQKLAIWSAPIVICDHITAVAQLGTDTGGPFGVCLHRLHFFNVCFHGLHLYLVRIYILNSFHNGVPLFLYRKIVHIYNLPHKHKKFNRCLKIGESPVGKDYLFCVRPSFSLISTRFVRLLFLKIRLFALFVGGVSLHKVRRQPIGGFAVSVNEVMQIAGVGIEIYVHIPYTV